MGVVIGRDDYPFRLVSDSSSSSILTARGGGREKEGGSRFHFPLFPTLMLIPERKRSIPSIFTCGEASRSMDHDSSPPLI